MRLLGAGEAAAPVEDEKTVVRRVDRAKAEQRSRPEWKSAPDHPWRWPFKPEATEVAAGWGAAPLPALGVRSLRSLRQAAEAETSGIGIARNLRNVAMGRKSKGAFLVCADEPLHCLVTIPQAAYIPQPHSGRT